VAFLFFLLFLFTKTSFQSLSSRWWRCWWKPWWRSRWKPWRTRRCSSWRNEGRSQGGCAASQARRSLHCTRQGGRAGHKELGARRVSLRREEDLSRGNILCSLSPLFSVSLTDLFADLTFFIFGFCSCSQEGEQKIEYRVWNPFRSKIAAAILGGVDNIHISPGKKVLYLGAASGTTVSHVADIVGPEGLVYAVEFSHRSGRDLINVAKKRTNVIPIIEDARRPEKYRMLVGMVSLPSFI